MSEVSKAERTERVGGDESSTSRRSPLSTTNQGFSVIERWLSYLGLLFLIGLMGMVVCEVISRYVFHRPIQGYLDIMEMMMAALVFLTLAYCQRQGGHIRMELFMTRVLKGGQRYQLTEFFHLLISLIGFTMIAFFASKEVLHAYNVGDVSMTVHLPTWPARTLAAIGSIFLCLRFIMQMVQSLTAVIVGGNKSER